MPSDQDSLAYTVMSYRSYTGAPTTEYANGTWDYPQTLMMHDIRAIQQLYGAGFDIVPTDTVYRWNPDTGEMTANRSTPILPGANRIFSTVWDGGGTDVYDFSNYTTDLTVNLGSGEWTTMSSEQLARLDANGSQMAPGNIANALLYNGDLRSIIENAIGGTGNDAMTGNQVANHLDGGDGADALYGLGGNDRLDGGLGDDRLDGGAGNDVAIFVGGRGVYAVRVFESGFRISGPEGSDVLAGIENLEFQDSTMSLAGLLPVALVLSDINADRAGEALWRYEDGRVVSWTLAGGALGSEAQLGTFGSAWTMDAAGDFNGDGTGDLLWRHASGYVAEWLMAGGYVGSEAGVGMLGTDWTIASSGDFNGDGTDDVLLQHGSGYLAEWLMGGGRIAVEAGVGLLGPGWTVAATGDFNGDGTDDLLWEHDSGYVAEWLMSGGQIARAAGVGLFGPGWSLEGTGDFNGDGTDDILWRHDSGYIADWLMNAGGHAVTAGVGGIGAGWTLAGTGDLDGDGTDDVLWRDVESGLHAWRMSGGTLAGQDSYDGAWHLS